MKKIYMIRNKVNNKMYVGQTSKTLEERFTRHLQLAGNRTNRYLYDAINCYGADNFEISLLEESEFADEREKFWIVSLGSLMPLGYNMTPGGGGGYTLGAWTEEERQKLYKQQGENRRGREVTPETRDKISKSHKGITHSEETKERIRKVCVSKGLAPPKEWWGKKGEPGFFTGKTHSKETRLILSKQREGKRYEEIFKDEARVATRKEELREHWLGGSNPNFVSITIDQKLEIVNLALGHSVSEISKILKISEFKIRQFFREHGVTNIQINRKNKWKNTLEEIGNAVRSHR